jgi:hypothetical protein
MFAFVAYTFAAVRNEDGAFIAVDGDTVLELAEGTPECLSAARDALQTKMTDQLAEQGISPAAENPLVLKCVAFFPQEQSRIIH